MMAYVMLAPYTRCMRPARRLQTSVNDPRRLGDMDSVLAIVNTAVNGVTKVVGAVKGNGNSFAPQKQTQAATQNAQPGQEAPENGSGNWLTTMPNSTLAVGGVAAAALLVALTR